MEHNQSASPSRTAAAPEQQRVLLHVLSPSAEVPQRLAFPDFSISSTVHELKIAIRNEVTTKPAPERQRLIYRGRALVHDHVTLREVIGQEAVSLHNHH